MTRRWRFASAALSDHASLDARSRRVLHGWARRVVPRRGTGCEQVVSGRHRDLRERRETGPPRRSAGPVVSAAAAAAMAEGARRLLDANVGLATTGVAGPDTREGLSPGTVFSGIGSPGARNDAVLFEIVGDRQRVRELGTMNTLDWLRRRLETDH